MKTIEIELRYEILDSQQLESFLAPMQRLHTTHDVDIYMDTPAAELYQRGIFIRIRNGKKLDIKFNRACLDNPELGIQDYCEEHSFALPLQEHDRIKINNVLTSLGLQPLAIADINMLKSRNNFHDFYTVDKVRTSYAHGPFTLAIDKVTNLGTFLEIELMTQTVENLAAIKQAMQMLLVGLAVKPLKTGYGTLLLRKQNFEQYVKGRFILEEDRTY